MRYLVGIGNYSGWDDSIGLRVIEQVVEAGLDRGFTAIELGGNLIDLVHYLGADTECVLIVDSARMGLAPGEFRLFVPDEARTRKDLAGFSTHEGDLLKVLSLAGSLGQPLPPITVLGIEAEEITTGIGLSRSLADRMGEYVTAAVGFFDDCAE